MQIIHAAQNRHTCKAFDPTRKIPHPVIDQLRAVLRNSPSSVNSQPWHFFIASSDAGKERLARAMVGGHAYNAPKIRDASHVIVLCSRTDLDDAYLATLLDQEDHDGRLAEPEARSRQDATRKGYVSLHRDKQNDLQDWMVKQVYIALGFLLLAAAGLEIDACPMEGFNRKILDEELGLAARGLTGIVLVSLGYRSDGDFNARLPKSRLPEDAVFSEI